MDISSLFNIGSIILSIGIAWGVTQAKIKIYDKSIDELKESIKECKIHDHNLVTKEDLKALEDSLFNRLKVYILESKK